MEAGRRRVATDGGADARLLRDDLELEAQLVILGVTGSQCLDGSEPHHSRPGLETVPINNPWATRSPQLPRLWGLVCDCLSLTGPSTSSFR